MKPSATALPSARFTRTVTPCAGGEPDSPAYRVVHDWNRQLREDETVSIRVERAAATARIGLAAPRRRAQRRAELSRPQPQERVQVLALRAAWDRDAGRRRRAQEVQLARRGRREPRGLAHAIEECVEPWVRTVEDGDLPYPRHQFADHLVPERHWRRAAQIQRERVLQPGGRHQLAVAATGLSRNRN